MASAPTRLARRRPKPALPVRGIPLIAYTLALLARHGVTEVVINVHHLGEQIEQHVGDGSRFGTRIIYSREEELLETGGGILNALTELGDQPFLVLSADVWMSYPLTNLPRELGADCDCHLVLVPNPSFHPEGDFQLNAPLPADGTSVPLVPGTSARYTYGNLSVVHPRLFEGRRL